VLVTSSLRHDRDLEFPFQTVRDLNELVEFLERAAVPEIKRSAFRLREDLESLAKARREMPTGG
jgi:hypothetical protein